MRRALDLVSLTLLTLPLACAARSPRGTQPVADQGSTPTRDESQPPGIARFIEVLYSPVRDATLIYTPDARVPGLRRLFTSRGHDGAPGVDPLLRQLARHGPYSLTHGAERALRIVMNDPEASIPQRCAVAYYLIGMEDPSARTFIEKGLQSPDVAMCHNAVEVLVQRVYHDKPTWEIQALRGMKDDPRLSDPAAPDPRPIWWERNMESRVRDALQQAGEKAR